FWQYSSTTAVPGIGGTGHSNACDVDTFNGTSTQLQQQFVIGSVPITVKQGSASIQDGQTTAINFGNITQGQTGASLQFTVTNSGSSTLTLGSVSVPTGYTLTDPLVTSLTVNASDMFTVRLESSTTGTKSGSVSFATSDPTRNPFN